MPILGVVMVILMEPDLEAAVTFYKNLGLEQIFHLKDKWAEFGAGSVRVGLCPTQGQPDGYIRTGIVLAVDDLHAIYNQFRDSDIFLGEPKEAAHGIMVSMKDPGNNILDLYQATPEKLAELVKKVAEKESKAGSCKEGGSDQKCADCSCQSDEETCKS